MSGNVLDLIDGAIGDHGDAMRWTPDPGCSSTFGAGEWFRQHPAAARGLTNAWIEITVEVTLIREAITQLAEAFDFFGNAYLGSVTNDLRRTRLSRMHAAYRRRRS